MLSDFMTSVKSRSACLESHERHKCPTIIGNYNAKTHNNAKHNNNNNKDNDV